MEDSRMSDGSASFGPRVSDDRGRDRSVFAAEAFERFVTFTAAGARTRLGGARERTLLRILAMQARRWVLHRSTVLDHARPSFDVQDSLRKRLGASDPAETILASFQFGSPVACAIELARRGHPITLPYLAIGPVAARRLRHAGVDLMDLGASSSPRQAIEGLMRRQREGRFVSILVDAAHPGRRRFEFLGYEVAASNMIATLADATGSTVIPVLSRLSGAAAVEVVGSDPLPPSSKGLVQNLLTVLETAVRAEPAQYDWRLSSLIYTDMAANKAALNAAARCLADRERLSACLDRIYGTVAAG